ncbi:MAG: GAF domain-containing protein [Chloroflexi bacterium]|nr:GAF domain-containing protein [Chloroflexota bacterium]
MLLRNRSASTTHGATRESIGRVALVLGALGLYLAVFLALEDNVGNGVESLVVLPVIVIAVLWGWKAGLAAGALGFPLNLGLLAATGSGSPDALIEGGAAARHLLVLLIGGGSGRIVELVEELKAQIYRRRSAQQSLAWEHAARGVLTDIGRVIGSSLEISESFATFAQLAGELVQYDRIMISTFDLEAQTITNSYVSGDRRIRTGRGEPLPLTGSLAEASAMIDETIVVGGERPWPATSEEPWELQGDMKSAICVPLRSRGAPIGTLTLCSSQADFYSSDDITMADQIGAQIGGAIGNARLHGQINRQLHERSVLAEIGRILAETRSLEEMLDALHEALKMNFRFDHVHTASYEATRNRMKILQIHGMKIAGVGPGDEFPAAELPGLEEAESGVCSCATAPEDHDPLTMQLVMAGMRSWISVPLRSRDRLVGLLVIASEAMNVYNGETLEMMREVASQVAPAVDNAVAMGVERSLFSRLESQNWDLLQARATMEAAAKELEAKNQALEAANETRTNFLSMISHELRTPLTIITGFAEYLSANIEDTLTDQQMQYVEVMQRNGQQLSRLVDDLLDVVRVESGQFEVNRVQLDAGDLVRAVIRDCEAVTAQKSQRIRSDISNLSGAAARMNGDRERLTQVISNLIGNASKYSDDGSEIEVRAWAEGGWFLFEVTDHGMGISEDDLSKIFHSFYRAPELKSQNVSGTGLGLVIARSIIEMHGGTVSVESEYGIGSTFRIRLPLAGADSTSGMA